MKTILIYGLGHIGSAIAKGLKGENEIYGFSRTDGKSRAENLGINFIPEINQDLISKMDYIFICTRNDDQKTGCEFFDQFNLQNKTIVSVASGVEKDLVKSYFKNNDPRILRIMPNLFSKDCNGTTLLDKEVADKNDVEFFGQMGSTYLIDEKLFSAGTIMSGCSPAYLAYIMKSFVEWGTKNDLNELDARGIISDLFLATGKFLKDENINIEKFIDSVCVPGGVTVEGIEQFKKDKVDEQIKLGLTKSFERDMKK